MRGRPTTAEQETVELHAELKRLARILHGRNASVIAFRSARCWVIRIEVPHQLARTLVRRRISFPNAANAAIEILRGEILSSGRALGPTSHRTDFTGAHLSSCDGAGGSATR